MFIHAKQGVQACVHPTVGYSIRTRGGKSKIRNERSRAAGCHECDLTDEIFISGKTSNKWGISVFGE